MTEKTVHTSSPEFLEVFRRHAGADAVMTFASFMELALYHPAVGYYARPQRRIGREATTDFFTAESLGPIFGELVVAACANLLGHRRPSEHTLVEIGVEPPNPAARESAPTWSSLVDAANPFAAVLTFPLGKPLALPSPAVVFSNELFDAQPFHRVVHHGGVWRENGIALRQGVLEEVLLPELSAPVQAVSGRLPASTPAGYRIDLPLAATRLAAQIAAQAWTGLFVAFDYGKSWAQLTDDTPAGTARAYRQHRQSNDLLANAGEQDLTCHVCWDWLVDTLADHGFTQPVLESQEAFFVHHAAPALRRITEGVGDGPNARKRALMQLLHPTHMGQKFQVLWALRDQTG